MNYDTGDLITKARIQDESWYPDYQALIEVVCGHSEEVMPNEELVRLYNLDYKSIFGRDYPNQEQLLRWCVLHTERAHRLKSAKEDAKFARKIIEAEENEKAHG